jgi:hypothetical protein
VEGAIVVVVIGAASRRRERARERERDLKESKAAVDVLFALSLSRAVLVFAGGAAVRCFGETQKNAKA